MVHQGEIILKIFTILLVRKHQCMTADLLLEVYLGNRMDFHFSVLASDEFEPAKNDTHHLNKICSRQSLYSHITDGLIVLGIVSYVKMPVVVYRCSTTDRLSRCIPPKDLFRAFVPKRTLEPFPGTGLIVREKIAQPFYAGKFVQQPQFGFAE